MKLRAFLADDEPLALKRLTRLLLDTGRFEMAGSATDPEAAVEFLSRERVDVLFLDIEMPGMNGFELLARLAHQPAVIFTTAFDQYALRAFEVNAIDYLLKPIEPEQLDRAIRKLERLGGALPEWMRQPDFRAVLDQIAACGAKSYCVDFTIAQLEQKLARRNFLRIHRSTLVNLDWVLEVNSWFAGGVLLRLKDEKHTELPVARDRVRALKQRLGF